MGWVGGGTRGPVSRRVMCCTRVHVSQLYLLAPVAARHHDDSFSFASSTRRLPRAVRFESSSSRKRPPHTSPHHLTPPTPTHPTCAQHFAAYSLEAWNGIERYGFDAAVSPRDEAETYFVAFNACVRDAKVEELMCSYNSINGAQVVGYARDSRSAGVFATSPTCKQT